MSTQSPVASPTFVAFALTLAACSGSGSDGRGNSLGAADAGKDAGAEADVDAGAEASVDAGPEEGSADGGEPAAADDAGDTPSEDAGSAADAGGGDAGTEPIGACSAALDSELCAQQVNRLSGLRWELPCTEHIGTAACSAADALDQTVEMPGMADASYTVRLRFRGVIELKHYTDIDNGEIPADSPLGTLVENPAVPHDGNNEYLLTVSDPPFRLALNHGVHQPWCQPLDATYTLQIRAGAVITLSAAAVDGAEVANEDESEDPIVIDGVPPAPAAFDGQFIQMDVQGIVPGSV